jgi:hypothetical protein
MADQGKNQGGRTILGTSFFTIGDEFLETEKDRRIGNMIKLSATLYMCNAEELNGLLEDFDDGTFESMWAWYNDNVTNKVENPEIDLGKTGPISQKYSNINNVDDDIKKLYDGLPAIPFNNLQAFVSNTFDPEFITSLRTDGDIDSYDELSKMLNIVAVCIMISCLNKEYMNKVESLIIKRSIKGIESPDNDSIVCTDHKKVDDFRSKYPILNNLN